MDIDDLLTIGSIPDWISPLWAIIQDLTNGPYCRFYVDRQAGFSVDAITAILRNGGVKYWGDMIADGMIIVTVREAQADQAAGVLYAAGVPVLGVG